MDKQKNNKPEKITPILQFAVLCDGITPPDQFGKSSFIGVFDRFLRTTDIPPFVLVMGWKAGKGIFSCKVRLLDPDLSEAVALPELTFELPNEVHGANTVIQFQGLAFKRTGVYWIEITLDSEVVMSVPLPIENKK